jgi:hypothetical protein
LPTKVRQRRRHPISNPFDPDAFENNDADDDDLVEAVFIAAPSRATTDGPRDPYDLEWLFVCFAWEAGYRDWTQGVRALARALRGLERTGLIERRTIRRAGRPTHHGFVLTEDGREAVTALSGAWIKEWIDESRDLRPGHND